MERKLTAKECPELRKRNPGKHKIHLIWDRAGYHRDQGVKEFAKGLAIEIHYLPNLNPMERLWKNFHEQVTYNKYYETFFDFIAATLHFFKAIGRNKVLLRSKVTNIFQVLYSPLFG